MAHRLMGQRRTARSIAAATLFLLLVVTSAPAAARAPGSAAPVLYQIDSAHSKVSFDITHLGFTTVTGRFGAFDGTITMEPGDLSTLHIEGSIDATSIDTGIEARDNHLRSADFFDVERYPRIRFVTRDATPLGDDRFRLLGELTMHGVTNEVTLDGVYGGEVEDPWGNVRGVFAATTTVSREDYGITWNQTLESGLLRLSDEVRIELAAEAIRQDGAS